HVGKGLRNRLTRSHERRQTASPVRRSPLASELGYHDTDDFGLIGEVGLGEPMPHAYVVTGSHSALGVDRPRAADVIEECKEVDVGEVLSRPASQPAELDGKQGISEGTFRRNVMGQIARQRNRGQELRKAKSPIR